MLKNSIITLTSDFGLKDPFAGLMKGAVLGINPEAVIVDISHNVQRHNVFEASQIVAMSYKYFPPTSIHVAVVDPGVGSSRRPLLIVTEDYYFIGPDNGIFTPVIEDLQSSFFKVYHLNEEHYFLPMKGATFHGRDIFAPVAAWLSKGVESHKMGTPVEDYEKISRPRPAVDGNTVKGEIVSIDTFGNAVSNIRRDDLTRLSSGESTLKLSIQFRNESIPFFNYYEQNDKDLMGALINSFGHMEIFVYQDSAARRHSISIGDSIEVTQA